MKSENWDNLGISRAVIVKLCKTKTDGASYHRATPPWKIHSFISEFCITGGHFFILLRGIQLTYVQRYWGSTLQMVLTYKIFTLNEAKTCVVLPNAVTAFGARTFLVLSQQ
jgi:hypothetical protein